QESPSVARRSIRGRDGTIPAGPGEPFGAPLGSPRNIFDSSSGGPPPGRIARKPYHRTSSSAPPIKAANRRTQSQSLSLLVGERFALRRCRRNNPGGFDCPEIRLGEGLRIVPHFLGQPLSLFFRDTQSRRSEAVRRSFASRRCSFFLSSL